MIQDRVEPRIPAKPPVPFATRRGPVVVDPAPASGWERALVITILLLVNGMSHLGVHIGGQGDQEDGGSAIAQLVWFLAYFAAIVGIAIERRRAVALLQAGWPILVLVGFVVLTGFWSGQPDLTVKRGIGLLGTTAIGFYFACRYPIAEFLRIFVIATGIAAILSLLAIAVLPTGRVYMDPLYIGAWQGIYDGKNYLGQAMSLGLVAVLSASTGGSKAITWRLAGVFGLCILLLIGSHSDSALLIVAGISAMLVTTLLWRGNPGARPAIGMAAIVLCGILGIAITLGFGTQTVFDALGRDSTLTGRTDVWEYVQKAIADRPWFGYGYSSFWTDPDGIGRYLPADAGWIPFHAHNGFLELQLDSGRIGLGVFIVACAIGLWRAVRLFLHDGTRESVWPLAIALYFLAANVTECSIAKYNNLGWIMYVVAYLYASRAASGRTPVKVRESVPAPEGIRPVRRARARPASS